MLSYAKQHMQPYAIWKRKAAPFNKDGFNYFVIMSLSKPNFPQKFKRNFPGFDFASCLIFR